jgi:hypothetical protein
LSVTHHLHEYHRLTFNHPESAAAFVAALSRFVNGPAGLAFRESGKQVEIWGIPNADSVAVSLFLSPDAVQATAVGFAQPPGLERCRGADVPPQCALIFGPDDRGAYGRDDIVRRMTNAAVGERER